MVLDAFLKANRWVILLHIYYSFFLFYLPDNNRKWITNNIGKVEERSGEETYQKL